MLRRVAVLLSAAALAVGISACGIVRLEADAPSPRFPTTERPSVRIAVQLDPLARVRNAPATTAAFGRDITAALSTGIVPFLTEELPGVQPRQHILAALRVRGAVTNPEGAELYADMLVRRGPGGHATAPVRIRLIKRRQYLVVVAVDRPGDGGGNDHDMRHLFPAWVRPRMNGDEPELVAALQRLERERELAERGAVLSMRTER